MYSVPQDKRQVPVSLLWKGDPGYRTDGFSYHGGVCGQLPDPSAGPENSGALPEDSIHFPGLFVHSIFSDFPEGPETEWKDPGEEH